MAKIFPLSQTQRVGCQLNPYRVKSWRILFSIANYAVIVINCDATDLRFHRWISELSQMFGGLDMCAIKAIQDTTGDYHIQDVSSSMCLLLRDSGSSSPC